MTLSEEERTPIFLPLKSKKTKTEESQGPKLINTESLAK